MAINFIKKKIKLTVKSNTEFTFFSNFGKSEHLFGHLLVVFNTFSIHSIINKNKLHLHAK